MVSIGKRGFMNIVIRAAQKSDASVILDLIIELAVYEKARHEVLASLEDIENSLFGEGRRPKR